MKRLIVSLLLFWLPLRQVCAQDCLAFKLREGTRYERLAYNASNKPMGRMTYQIKTVLKEAGNTVIDVVFQAFDDNDKAVQTSTLRYTCTGNELLADLSGFLAGRSNAAFREAELRMKVNRLPYPAQYEEGQTLPDGQLESEYIKDRTEMATSTIVLKNRQVGARESLTVPAGTFEVYKISADVEIRNRIMGLTIPVSLRSISYRTPDQLFDIRTETYNRNGKLMGYTVLSKIN